MMINLVRNDVGSTIQATITDSSGSAVSLQNVTCYLHFKKIGATTHLYSITGEIIDATNGVVNFVFDSNKLDQDAGRYQGEIEVVGTDGNRDTVYDQLNFNIREEIA